MIVDITGTILIPGNSGKDCPGNGYSVGIQCCCDECDYMMCCTDTHSPQMCRTCEIRDCPRHS